MMQWSLHDDTRQMRDVETVALGTPFSLTTPLLIQRKARLFLMILYECIKIAHSNSSNCYVQ